MVGNHQKCIELYCNDKYKDKLKPIIIDQKNKIEFTNYMNYIGNRENKLENGINNNSLEGLFGINSIEFLGCKTKNYI